MKKLILRALLALCIGSSVVPVLAVTYLTTTSDPNASQATKNVYDYLRTRRGQSTNRMIEGQFLGMINQILYPGQSFYGYFDINQHVIDGKLPGMAGSRYDGEDKETNVYRLDADICTRVNQKLIEVWNDVQPIIHITATPRNPWNQQLGREPDNSTTQKISALLLAAPASTAKTNFWADIDVIAGGLQELENQGIPVLFRPFAEFNMSAKYYFDKQVSTDFVTLWQQVYNYYVTTKGLHNLLFCWEAWALNRNATSSNIAPWYPGENYVDVVAGAFYFQPEIDYYDASGNFSFAQSDPEDQGVYNYLIGRNRPFGAAQYGLNQGTNTPGDHEFTRDFMDYSPDLAFAAYWNQFQAVERQDNASAFVADPRVATHDDLPLFTSTTVTFTSASAYDGYIPESGETTNVGGTPTSNGSNTLALRAGDNNLDRQLKTVVSFNTSSIPDSAVITAVTLRLKRGGLTGQNPFSTHGTCRVDIIGGSGFGGALALAAGDFQAAAGASQVATMSDPGSNGNWSTGTVNASGLTVLNKTGSTQFRVYFATDDNDDSGDDYVGWYSGEAAAGNQPELVVTYQ